jgi:hypothetical protein
MDIDKRILGFAGPTSSMQYVMRMEEKLLEPPKKVAAQPPAAPLPSTSAVNSTPTTQIADQPSGNSSDKTSSPRRPARTASRPPPQATKGYRRF